MGPRERAKHFGVLPAEPEYLHLITGAHNWKQVLQLLL